MALGIKFTFISMVSESRRICLLLPLQPMRSQAGSVVREAEIPGGEQHTFDHPGGERETSRSHGPVCVGQAQAKSFGSSWEGEITGGF